MASFIRKQESRLNASFNNYSMPGAPKRRHPQADRTKRGVGLVLITAMSCWFPVLLFPYFSATLKSDEDILRGKLWCISAACVNSCIDPFIENFGAMLQSCFERLRENLMTVFCETPTSVAIGSLGKSNLESK